jgi:replicative DNA helicase
VRPEPDRRAITAATLLEEPGVGRSGVERWFPTGFEPLDGVLGGGLRPGELVMVGGRPGVGKTVAALQWARCMAMAGTTVVYACYSHEERFLLARLLGMELLALSGGEDDRTVAETRRELERISRGRCSVEETVGPPGGLLQRTTARLRSYGDRLFLLRASGDGTGVAELRRILDSRTADDATLFVDHLQGISHPGAADHAERTARVARALKGTAMSDGVAVVAVSGTTDEGLTSRRVRLHHLQGADGIVYESDIVLILNQKVTAVAKAHRVGHPLRARRYDQYVVVSLEKNRRGAATVDLDFRKDFAHHRFDPEGTFTLERLVGNGAGTGHTTR